MKTIIFFLCLMTTVNTYSIAYSAQNQPLNSVVENTLAPNHLLPITNAQKKEIRKQKQQLRKEKREVEKRRRYGFRVYLTAFLMFFFFFSHRRVVGGSWLLSLGYIGLLFLGTTVAIGLSIIFPVASTILLWAVRLFFVADLLRFFINTKHYMFNDKLFALFTIK